MLRRYLIIPAALLALPGFAQPDTLLVTSGDSLYRFAVIYGPMPQSEQFKRIGHYAQDTTLRGACNSITNAGNPAVYIAPFSRWEAVDLRGLRIWLAAWRLDGIRRVRSRYGQGPVPRWPSRWHWAFRTEGIVGHYKDGKRHGKWKYYERGRLVKVEKYRDDALISRQYLSSRRTMSHLTFVNCNAATTPPSHVTLVPFIPHDANRTFPSPQASA